MSKTSVRERAIKRVRCVAKHSQKMEAIHELAKQVSL